MDNYELPESLHRYLSQSPEHVLRHLRRAIDYKGPEMVSSVFTRAVEEVAEVYGGVEWKRVQLMGQKVWTW